MLTTADIARFEKYISYEPNSGCWLWLGALNSKRYGRFRVGKRNLFAHVVSYVAENGAISPGLELDHICRTRECVNPSHLEAVSHAENVKRAAAVRTKCPLGHEYDGTRKRGNRTERHCSECSRISTRKYARRLHARNHTKAV